MAEHDRQAIALEHIGLVKKVASKIFYKLPPCDIEFDDLVNTGMIGLMKAIDKYDREQAKFSTYAYIKIRGEILDYLRSLEVVPRTMKEKIKKEEEENPDAKPLPLSNAAVLVSMEKALNIDGANYRLIDTLVSSDRSPEEETELAEMGEKIAMAMQRLSDKERTVLQMLFFEERDPKEVTLLLHISASRVSQLKSQAVGKLKTALKQMNVDLL
jgi:RNA polymerase sigma factor for flagellar operon FliA